jgi:hypothetical protein
VLGSILTTDRRHAGTVPFVGCHACPHGDEVLHLHLIRSPFPPHLARSDSADDAADREASYAPSVEAQSQRAEDGIDGRRAAFMLSLALEMLFSPLANMAWTQNTECYPVAKGNNSSEVFKPAHFQTLISKVDRYDIWPTHVATRVKEAVEQYRINIKRCTLMEQIKKLSVKQ